MIVSELIEILKTKWSGATVETWDPYHEDRTAKVCISDLDDGKTIVITNDIFKSK